jgi:hypothetical protein
MSQPKLSICIPTFNRAGILRDTLAQIARSVECLSLEARDLVEVIIVDNASTDGTPEVVAEFVESLPNLQIGRNPENVGVERNIVNALQLGTGEWVWPLGDDDFISPDALPRILEILSEPDRDLGLLLLNYGQRGHDGREELSQRVCAVPDGWRGTLFGDDGLYKFAGSFDLLAFISAIIVRRSLLKFHVDYGVFKSYYGHVGIIAASCAGCGVGVLGPGLMTQRQNNTRLDTNAPAAATVIITLETFVGCLRMLNAVRETTPAAEKIYAMSVKEGLGPIEDATVLPVATWFFNAFARPDLIQNFEDEQEVRAKAQVLDACLPYVLPAAAKREFEKFRRSWGNCFAAYRFYQELRSAL